MQKGFRNIFKNTFKFLPKSKVICYNGKHLIFFKSSTCTKCDRGYLKSIDNLRSINSLSPNLTKWPNTLKQFVDKLPTNYLGVFDHFVKLSFGPLLSSIYCKKG